MIDYNWNLHHENDKNDKLRKELDEVREVVKELRNTLNNESRIRQHYVEKCTQLKKDVEELRVVDDQVSVFLKMCTEFNLSLGRSNQIIILKKEQTDGGFLFAISDEYRTSLGKSSDLFCLEPSNSNKTDDFFLEFRYSSLDEALKRLSDYFKVDLYDEGTPDSAKKIKKDQYNNLDFEVRDLLGINTYAFHSRYRDSVFCR